MTESIDIVVDEGMSVPGHMQSSRDVETNSARQFTSSKVNVRTERNPTVRKAMASPGHIGWKEAMNDEWSLLSGRKEGRA
jgi:hypothetical protein